MSVVIHSPQTVSLYRRDSATSVTPLVPSLDPAGYGYGNPAFPGGDNVKDALDELLRLSTPKAEPGWQLFESSGQFIVPSGVTEVLLLAIEGGGEGGMGAAHSNTNGYGGSGGSGGRAVSLRVALSPGETVPVTMQADTYGQETIQFGRYYRSRNASGNEWTPEGAIFKSRAGNGGRGGNWADGKAGAHGGRGGGFAVESGTDEERRAQWLALALTESPEGHPGTGAMGKNGGFYDTNTASGACWPCNTATKAPAAGYGGGGGGGAGGSNNVSVRPAGGALMVFWGPDIHPDSASISPETTT